ncbi:hypothetical protein ACE6H2_007162 [Prunus campanulata]
MEVEDITHTVGKISTARVQPLWPCHGRNHDRSSSKSLVSVQSHRCGHAFNLRSRPILQVGLGVTECSMLTGNLEFRVVFDRGFGEDLHQKCRSPNLNLH